MIIMNNKLLKINTRFVSKIKSASKPIVIPEGTDFIYLARNYIENEGIPNSVENTEMGTYGLRRYNMTVEGENADSYLKNGNSRDYSLNITLTDNIHNKMKALNAPYTYYARVANTSGVGGIFSWREQNDGYNYMIRTNGNKLQFHDSTGKNTIDIIDGNVIKIYVFSNRFTVTDLDTGISHTGSINLNRTMGNIMTTFYAGRMSTEYKLGKMYGLAGIGRETSAEEDEFFRNILHKQEI